MHSAVAYRPFDVEAGTPRSASGSTVDRTTTPSGTRVRRLPHGARIVELWTGPEHLTLTASGDIDASDQYALVDLITGGILRGARRVQVDASTVTSVDVAVLRSLLRCRRFLARSGGSLTVTGLRGPFDLAWLLLDAESPGADATPLQARPAGLIGALPTAGRACA